MALTKRFNSKCITSNKLQNVNPRKQRTAWGEATPVFVSTLAFNLILNSAFKGRLARYIGTGTVHSQVAWLSECSNILLLASRPSLFGTLRTTRCSSTISFTFFVRRGGGGLDPPLPLCVKSYCVLVFTRQWGNRCDNFLYVSQDFEIVNVKLPYSTTIPHEPCVNMYSNMQEYLLSTLEGLCYIKP